MIVINIIQALLLIPIGFFIFYLAALTMLALRRKEKQSFPSNRTRRFAVVVPAHDEALVIETTLKSLRGLDYPREQFDVVVVADNCNDETAALALESGAVVYERTEPQLRGKGYALRWCFDRLLNHRPGYDAFIVIDADSVVSKNFLAVMNHYLESGARVIQCADFADAGSQSWIAEVIGLSFLLYNFVRPLGRSVIGCSAGLRGNGMCFASEVLTEVPWSSFSLNEDLEYGLELLLKGVSVRFAPEAQVFAKMPQNEGNARSQRVRWEAGRFPIMRRYGLKLVGAAFSSRSFKLFDAFVDLMTPSLVNMLAIASGMFALNLLMVFVGGQSAIAFMILWMGVLALGVIHVTVGIVAAKAKVSTLLSLLHVPRYFLWKLKLYIGLGRSGTDSGGWIRTTREAPGRDLQQKRSFDKNK